MHILTATCVWLGLALCSAPPSGSTVGATVGNSTHSFHALASAQDEAEGADGGSNATALMWRCAAGLQDRRSASSSVGRESYWVQGRRRRQGR